MGIFVWHSQCPYIFILVRASTSVRVNFFSFYTSKTYLFYFTHLFLQNTYINLSIIHIYSNKIFIFLILWTVTVRGERKEKRVRWREKREKKNKKIICTVNSNRVYIYGYCSFARPLCIFRHFYKNWWGGVWVKMCKIWHFLYFRRISMSWCGWSKLFNKNQILRIPRARTMTSTENVLFADHNT